MNKFLVGLSLLIILFSCNNDDDGPFIEPPRPRGPQAIVDNTILEDFLKTHTYNDVVFEGEHTLTNNDISFYKLTDGKLPDDIGADTSTGMPLIDSDKLIRIQVLEGLTEQTLYVLKIREGSGRSLSRLDDVYTSFRGSEISTSANNTISLNSRIFEGSDDDIGGWMTFYNDNIDQSIPGLTVGISQFKSATSNMDPESMQTCDVFEVDSDSGETNIKNNDFGIGAIFVPSGLGYYNNPPNRVSVNQYSNLVYTFSLFNVEYRDHDNDGVLSRFEQASATTNNDYFDDDSDNDGLPNFLDNNDDGDAQLTRSEVVILDNPDIDFDCDGIKTNDNEGVNFEESDKNNNNILDYLEPEI